MTKRVVPPRRGSYGVDAPIAPAILAIVAIIQLTLAFAAGKLRLFVPAVATLFILTSYMYGTLRLKFALWAKLLDELSIGGDERILDLGCGRGAVLLMAAQRLSTGKAVGIDLWRTVDQSGNSLAATQQNAVAEGVADRVELHTADMTALPFSDNTFDIVLSSLAIHNIRGSAGRAKAIAEAVRVLRPGGRLMIVDVRETRHYASHLTALGMHNVARRRVVPIWLSIPWGLARVVTATKV